jgi:hypothetical protein
MNTFETIATVPVTRHQFERFKSGELWQEWSSKHPELFDKDDIRVAKTQAKLGYHFYEWLAALTLYQSTGYLSLIESYEFKGQKRKQEIMRDILPAQVLSAVEAIAAAGDVQCPDLLCYHPETKDWFFCEVKGPTDSVRPRQEKWFQTLVDASDQPIRVVNFTYASA